MGSGTKAQKSKIVFSQSHGGYILSGETEKPIEVKVAENDVLQQYYLKEFKSIFPSYDKDTDTIDDFMGTGGKILLQLNRRISSIEGEECRETAKIDKGLYRFVQTGGQWVLAKVDLSPENMDEYVDLGRSCERVRNDIELFFDKKEDYKRLRLNHRRGALIYGPPGNGKTYHLMRIFEKHDGIAIMIPSSMQDMDFLISWRDPLKDNRVILVMEEITQRLNGRGNASDDLLSFMDGEYSWTGCYVVATTNHPDMLPGNLVDRPGRFDVVIAFPFPTDGERAVYFRHHLPDAPKSDIEQIVASTKDYSLSYLKEIVLRIKLHDNKIADVAKEIRERKKLIKAEFSERQRTGFGDD